jgi:predicted ATPase
MDPVAPRKIVLTGGPGAGKTIAAREVARRLVEAGHRVQYIPEAATQVYERLGRKWNELTLDQRRAAQTAMYRLQLEQEAEAARSVAPGTTLLLDRGTIDGAGYWPDGPQAFWPAMHTTHPQELARYHAVLWLETAATLGLYDHDASNPVRFENPHQAIQAGELQANLWSNHPNLYTIPAQPNFNEKLAQVEATVLPLLPDSR